MSDLRRPLEIRGIIFDLDGTVVDTALDFDAIRAEMELPPGRAILETIADLPPEEQSRCRQILERHERGSVEAARLMPGISNFMAAAARHQLRMGLLTRNHRAVVLDILARLGLWFDPVTTRDDGPIKPDPAGIWRICESWEMPPSEVAVIGDYIFDLQAARRAGSRAVLYSKGRDPAQISWAGEAEFVLHSFEQSEPLWQWLATGGRE